MKFKEMNVPNKLTTIRMIIVPIVMVLFLMYGLFTNGILNVDGYIFKNDQGSLTIIQLIICILFLLASFTDFLDGNIARKQNIVSDYGKLMDPLADKLLVNSTLINMMIFSMYSFTNVSYLLSIVTMFFALVTIVRDIFVDALRMQALKKNVVVPAFIYGKLKTATLMPGVALLILGSINVIVFYIGSGLIILGGIFALIGGIKYFNSLKQYIGD